MAEKLGPYTLDKRIGSGGMADVFLAQGPRGVCVIKRPHPALCANPEFVRMFLDEASLLAQLHHKGIAQIFDLGEVRGVYYLAMEYVPGFDLMTISLEHERQGELIAPELCARIVADAAVALHSAHEAKSPDGRPLALVHRDVSPHNILLSTRGEVKIIDFGVARAATTMHRTQAGYVKGKYPYMSPEQITGGNIDRRVDVYALGLVLYELLTNVRAIAGQTEVEQIDNARAGLIRPIEQLRPNTPVPLQQIIASCLYPDPEGRYPTALALRDDLEKYLTFEHHVVGQEDLLRLFRVVAAEAMPNLTTQPVPPVSASDMWLGGARPTEREQPVSAVLMPEGDAATLPPDDSMGVAHTAPSMRVPAITPDQLKSTEPDRRAVKRERSVVAPAAPGISRALGGVAVVTALVLLGAVGVWWSQARTAPVLAVVDAGPGDADVPAHFQFPEDAGAVAEDEAVDAGQESASPFVDAGVEVAQAVASLHVASVPVADLFVDKKAYGRTPADVQVDPGAHAVRLVNKAEGFTRALTVTVEAGDRRAVSVVAKKGVLRVNAVPFASMKLNGAPITDRQVSFREVEVWDGTYQLELVLADPSLPAPKIKRVSVTIKGGEVTTVSQNLLE
jgi:serine/threonine-protein kinase